MTIRATLMATAAAALIAVAALAPASPAAAEGTTAVVVNQRDDSEVYRLMLQIRRATGDVVDTTNVAAAVASCDYCQTVAIALQGVLVMSDPSIFIPENMALAINVDCDFCQTLASAYQTLVQTGGPVHFTAEGNREIAEIRQELESLRNAGLSIEEIQQRVDELNTRLQQVLWTQVVPSGGSGSADAAPAADTAPADNGTTSTPTEAQPAPTPSESGTTTTDTGTQQATTAPSETGTTTTEPGTTTTETGATTTDTTSTDTTTTDTTTTTTDSTPSP